MEESRRAEIRQIIDHFGGQTPHQKVLDEYCQRMKFEQLVVSDFDDYKYQVEHDTMVSKMFPQILGALQKISYIPEFASESERKKLREQNDNVRVEVTKLLEEHAVPYRLVSTLTNELGRMVGQTIEMAGTTAFNKSLEVLLHLAHQRFGGDFNMKHAADYAIEVMEKATGTKFEPEPETE